MEAYQYITLRERPEWREKAAQWFHEKWGVPKEAYLACMDSYLNKDTEYGWYLCLDGDKVYTESDHRKQGIAGKLLDMTVDDMRSKGITPLYLVTDHTGFYERYGWEFLCMVQGSDPEPTRMYVHY